MHSTAYRPDVDGLRAIAVIPVVLFHAGLGFHGGFVGVDVFFVISGYLITSLILRDLHAGKFSLVEFWERRFRRILPALAVVVAATAIIGAFLLLPADVKLLAESVVAQSLFLSNVQAWRQSGYFAPSSETIPLLHLWSLAIEEQFYLLLPIALWCLRGLSRPALFASMGGVALVSFAASVYGTTHDPSFTFYMLPTRAWELLVGCLIPLLPLPGSNRRPMIEFVGMAGLFAILFACLAYDERTPFPGVAALLPCLGAAGVIWSGANGTTHTRRLLAWSPLVAIGLCSYSLYLWHWPIMVYAKYWAVGRFSVLENVGLVLVSLAAATLSLRFIERPFREKRLCGHRRPLFATAFSTVAILLLAGLATTRTDGFTARFDSRFLEVVQAIDAENDFVRASTEEVSLDELRAGELYECTPSLKHEPVGCLLWGDSTARPLLALFESLGQTHSLHTVAAVHSANPPVLGYENLRPGSLVADTEEYNTRVVDFIRERKIPQVVLSGRWGAYDPLNKRGRDRHALADCLLNTVRTLRQEGVQVWIVHQPPEQAPDTRRQLFWSFDPASEDVSGITTEQHAKSQADAKTTLARTLAEGAHLLDTTDLFATPDGRLRLTVGKRPLYRDGYHLTRGGAMFMKPLFEPIFSEGIEQTAFEGDSFNKR